MVTIDSLERVKKYVAGALVLLLQSIYNKLVFFNKHMLMLLGIN